MWFAIVLGVCMFVCVRACLSWWVACIAYVCVCFFSHVLIVERHCCPPGRFCWRCWWWWRRSSRCWMKWLLNIMWATDGEQAHTHTQTTRVRAFMAIMCEVRCDIQEHLVRRPLPLVYIPNKCISITNIHKVSESPEKPQWHSVRFEFRTVS